MTRIFFMHGAKDRMLAAAEWLDGMVRVRRRVMVYVPEPERAARFDQMLWTQPATGFLPHCRAESTLAGETPILIATRLETPAPGLPLLNLGDSVPPGYERFDEITEVVSVFDVDRIPARERFRFYREHNCELHNRDLAGAH